MADSNGAVDLGSLSPEEQEAVHKMAEENPAPEGSYPGDQHPEENKQKVLTAFGVVVGYDGNPSVVKYTNDDVLLQVQPNSDLIYAACATLQKDLAAVETAEVAAQMTASFMAQQARAMQEQYQAQQVQQALQKTGLKR